MKRIGLIFVCMMLVTSFIVIFPVENAKADLTTGLVGYWSLNETSGSIVHDYSGNNNNGNLYGPIWANDGALDGGLSFDGINDYALIPHSESLNFADENSFSVSFWINSSGTLISLREVLVSLGTGAINSGFYITREFENKTILFAIGDGDLTNYCGLFSNGMILENFWYHVAIVWDGNTIYIYINGSLDNSVQLTSFNYADDSKPLEFGNHWGYTGNNHPFHGILDEIRIYNRALTENEIKSLYGEESILVDIDIKPGDYPNSINPNSNGKIPVAILTTDDFDAFNIDQDSILFLDASPNKCTMEDVDDDGDIDMLLNFKVQECNFSLLVDEGDEYPYAYLTGETISGDLVEGKDTIRLVRPLYIFLEQFLERLIHRFPFLEKILNQCYQ